MIYGPPIPYMECRNLVTGYQPHVLCGNLVTVNNLWFPHTLYGMWEPCNCQWLIPYTLYGMQEPCNGVSPTCMMWFFRSPIPVMDCQNLVTVNVSYCPHTLYGMWEACNVVPYMYNMIWMQEPCNCQWLLWSLYTLYGMWEPCNSLTYGPPYLIWNAGTL